MCESVGNPFSRSPPSLSRLWSASLRSLSCLGFLVSSILVPASGSASPAGSPLSSRICGAVNSIVRSTLAEDGSPSVSFAIVLNGQLSCAAAYGAARLSPVEIATTGTRYQLASLSKTLTADAMLLLEQNGKLSLNDPVARWLPSVTDATHVTILNLLDHTAGYPDHYPQAYPAGPRTKRTTPDRIIADWGHHKLLFAPGSAFSYSNMNYLIAGRLIEKVSQESLFTFLQQNVFAPLRMSDTINLDEISAQTPRIAIGYVRNAIAPLEPAPHEGAGWSFGAGQVVSTASDLARWDAAFIDGRLLAPAQAREQIATPLLADGSSSRYALGLFVSHIGGRIMYYHMGQGLGFLAINRIYPTEHAAIVVLTNDSSALTFRHVADRIEYLVVPPTPPDAEARAIFMSLQIGKLDRSKLTVDLSTYFNSRLLAEYKSSLGPLGAPVSFVLHDQEEADGLTTRFYDIVAGRKKLRLLEQTEPDGRVESFQIQLAAG